MVLWKDRVILLFTLIYLIIFCILCNQYYATPITANEKNYVLGATTELHDIPGLPSLSELLVKTNTYRRSVHAPLLTVDKTLLGVAQARADDMAKRKYYAHKSPDGQYFYDQLKLLGYPSGYSCENLSLHSSPKVDTHLNQWLNSILGHKQCLLNSTTTKVGYGVAKLEGPGVSNDSSYIIVAIQAD